MKVEPLSNFVLLSVTEYSHSRVVLPEALRKKLPKGIVVSCGKYCSEDYKEGQEVLFNKSGSKALPNDLVLVQEHRITLKEEQNVHNSSKQQKESSNNST